MMNQCPHCSSEASKISDTTYFCSFCDSVISNLNAAKSFVLRGAVDYVDAAKSTNELQTYHTFDLLLLLRFCRQERRDTYDLMQTVGRLSQKSNEAKKGYKEAYELYKHWTKKTRIAESLVKERIGIVPKAVTNDFLNQYSVLLLDYQNNIQVKYA